MNQAVHRRIRSLTNFAVMLVMIYLNYLHNLNKILGPVLRYFLKIILPLRDWQKISLCFISALRRIGSLPNFAVMLVMIYLNYLHNLNKILGSVFEIFLKDHFAAPRLAENILVFHICPQKNRIVTKLCSHACNDIFELPANLNKILGPVFEIFLKDHFAAPRLAENILVFHICPQKNRIVSKLCSHARNDIFELPAKFKQNIGTSFWDIS